RAAPRNFADLAGVERVGAPDLTAAQDLHELRVPVRIERLTRPLACLGENARLEHALLATFLGFRGRIAPVDQALADLGRRVLDRWQRRIVREAARRGKQHPLAGTRREPSY